jgi:hypothetical protein
MAIWGFGGRKQEPQVNPVHPSVDRIQNRPSEAARRLLSDSMAELRDANVEMKHNNIENANDYLRLVTPRAVLNTLSINKGKGEFFTHEDLRELFSYLLAYIDDEAMRKALSINRNTITRILMIILREMNIDAPETKHFLSAYPKIYSVLPQYFPNSSIDQ